MRVADKMQFEQVKNNVSKNRSQMSELQNQAAAQKRVTKPSDDPLAASRVLSNRIDLQGNRQFTKSLNYAKSFLEITDQSLGDLSEVLMRAKELAIAQSNDASANEESRKVVATEIEQLHNAMVAIGNRKLGDRFIFGGYNTMKAPFNETGRYAGDTGEMNIHIEKETFMPMNIPGSRVFLGEGINKNGLVKKSVAQARTIEELNQQLSSQPWQQEEEVEQQAPMRGPASMGARQSIPMGSEPKTEKDAQGADLFQIMKSFEISLRTNDKAGVQESLDQIDEALSQVVLTRAQVGSRGMRLDSLMHTLEKNKVDNQTNISALEDADIFATVSDINKTESTLQATLATSGKLIQPSLLDFLR